MMRWIIFSVRGLVRSSDGKILLLKRSRKCRYCPDCWELPGGKIETGNFKKDFRREVMEEAGLSLAEVIFRGVLLKESALDRVIFGWPGWIWVFFVSAACSVREIKLSNEHTEGGWFALAQAEALDLTPETRHMLKKYARRREQI